MQKLFVVLALCGAYLSMKQYTELQKRYELEHQRAEALAVRLYEAEARLSEVDDAPGESDLRFVAH